ncbi:MAG: YraN family protein [Balneolaceae bacterium]
MKREPNTTKTGQRAEELAAKWLEEKGWMVLDRNYRFMRSEIDIVAFDQTFIVFIEVKYRSDSRFGHPEEFITPDKEKHIRKAAEAWLYERKMEGALTRFDAIAILKEEADTPGISHFENVFR